MHATRGGARRDQRGSPAVVQSAVGVQGDRGGPGPAVQPLHLRIVPPRGPRPRRGHRHPLHRTAAPHARGGLFRIRVDGLRGLLLPGDEEPPGHGPGGRRPGRRRARAQARLPRLRDRHRVRVHGLVRVSPRRSRRVPDVHPAESGRRVGQVLERLPRRGSAPETRAEPRRLPHRPARPARLGERARGVLQRPRLLRRRQPGPLSREGVPAVPKRRAVHARVLLLPAVGRVAVEHAGDVDPDRRRGTRSAGLGRAREQG